MKKKNQCDAWRQCMVPGKPNECKHSELCGYGGLTCKWLVASPFIWDCTNPEAHTEEQEPKEEATKGER